MQNSPTTAQVIDRFIRSRRAKNLRPLTLRWYWSRLTALPLPLPFADLSPDYVRARLDRLELSPPTRRNYARAWVALWTWARRSDIAAQDVAPALYREPALRDSAGAALLSVADAARAMRNLAPEYRPAAAMLLFTGLRPQELRGIGKPPLTYAAVNQADRIVRVPADIAKTRKWRVLEGLPGTLWDWLPQSPDPAQPISPVSSARLIDLIQLAAGFIRQGSGRGAKRERLRAWPHDGTRHGFATYALALTSDAARVALWLGHEGNTTMLHRHYRGLATKADAERYFAIRP